MNKLSILYVFAAMFLGVLFGLMIHQGDTAYSIVVLMGDLFMNALKLVIVPLVVSSIITGIARLGEEEGIASLGVKTFSYFFLITSIASIVGLFTVLMMQPGLREVAAVAKNAIPALTTSLGDKLGEILLKFFPQNIFAAAAEGQMVGLIVFSIMFGFFATKIDKDLSRPLINFWKGVFLVMMKITQFIMKFLPIGVFALIAKVIAETGLEGIKSSGWFFATMLIAFVIYVFGVMPLFLRFVANVNPWTHMKAMAPALLTAFTTSSSSATLPVTLECLEKRAGVPNRIAGFTLPIGTSFHMAGTAMFECVAVIFIAQFFGIPLTFSDYGMITLLSIILSIGIAGVPSGCIVAVIPILTMMNLPQEGIALLYVVERILDMLRTVVNVYSNTVCTVLISK